jgi:hypothetical protein
MESPALAWTFRSGGRTLAYLSVGVLVLYASNALLVSNFGAGMPFWPILSARIAAYACLVLAMASAAIWTARRLAASRHRFALWQRIALGSLFLALANALVLASLVLPAYRLLTGVPWDHALSLYLQSSILGMNVHACVLLYQSLQHCRQRGLAVQLENDNLEIALDRAEIAILEAQIEPHFLFNTLAHIAREYRIEADCADELIDALVQYMDGALPALRRDDWTVGDELGLVATYLRIQERRFADRLRFCIDATPASEQLRLPALTIATLVENAVRHGLAPKAEGGSLSIRCKVDAGSLHIDVCDTGVGLQADSGSGLGLLTVRARLQNAYGQAAQLTVVPGVDAGVKASVQVLIPA